MGEAKKRTSFLAECRTQSHSSSYAPLPGALPVSSAVRRRDQRLAVAPGERDSAVEMGGQLICEFPSSLAISFFLFSRSHCLCWGRAQGKIRRRLEGEGGRVDIRSADPRA